MADVLYFADLAVIGAVTGDKILAVQSDPTGSFGFKLTLDEYADYVNTTKTYSGLNTADKTIVENANSVFTMAASSGLLTGGAITDAGGGNVDVAAGNGLFRTTDSHTGILVELPWLQSLGIAIPSDTIRYIGVEYNAGSPQVVVKSTDTWDIHTEFSLGSVVNEAGTIHLINNPWMVANADGHAIERFYETRPFEKAARLGGLIVDETGTRNIILTAGEIYDRTNEFNISDLNTSVTGSFDSYLGLILSSAANIDWDNLNYDNSGVLTGLGISKWGVLWWYIEADDSLVMVYGTQEHNTSASAFLEDAPSVIPLRLQVHSSNLPTARTVFQQNAATGLFTNFSTALVGAPTSDHTELSNLTTGDSGHAQFAMLSGRSGGQDLVGGSSALEKLTLESTSSPTKGIIEIKDPLDIPNATGGDLLSIGVATEASNPKVTIRTRNSGFAPPSNTNGISLGDKWVFWNQVAYKGAIGFDARTMWFQSTEGTPTVLNRFKFFAGGSAIPVEILAMGDDAGFIWNDTGLPDADFRCEGDTDENLFFLDAGTDQACFGTATPVGGAKLTIAGNLALSSGTFKLPTGTTINEISIDGTLIGASDDAVPTEQAVKTYVDTHTELSKWDLAATVLTPDTANSSVEVNVNNTQANPSITSKRTLSTGTGDFIAHESVIIASVAQTAGDKVGYKSSYTGHVSDTNGIYKAFEAADPGTIGDASRTAIYVGANHSDAIFTESGKWVESVSTDTPIIAATGITVDMLKTANLVGKSSTTVDSIVSSIVTGVDGQILTIIGFDDTKTITFNSSTANVELIGGRCTLGNGDRLILKSYNNKWREVSRNVPIISSLQTITTAGITAAQLAYPILIVQGNSVGGVTDISAISTSGAVAGQKLGLVFGGTNSFLRVNSGTNLKIDNGASFLMGPDHIINFIFDGTDWQESTRKANL